MLLAVVWFAVVVGDVSSVGGEAGFVGVKRLQLGGPVGACI
jgi:hypothetical protein